MDYPSQLAFDEYLQLMFLPSLAYLSLAKNKDSFSESFARAELFEALEWLRLGVELNVFTPQSAGKLLQEYRLSIYEQCQLYAPEWEYVLPPNRLRGILRMIETNEVEANAKFENPSRLSATFQVLIDLVGRIESDQGASSFWTALLYLPEASWRALVSRQVLGSEIMAAVRRDQDLWVDGNRSFIYAGYLRVIQHLEDTLEVLDFDHRAGAMQDWVLLRRLFKEIHGWRHNDQKNKVVTDRQADLTTQLALAMKTDFAAEGGSIESRMFAHYIEDLYKRWGGLATPAVRFAGN
jgi:hypothetical protein